MIKRFGFALDIVRHGLSASSVRTHVGWLIILTAKEEGYQSLIYRFRTIYHPWTHVDYPHPFAATWSCHAMPIEH
jgi:hypothetical protein